MLNDTVEQIFLDFFAVIRIVGETYLFSLKYIFSFIDLTKFFFAYLCVFRFFTKTPFLSSFSEQNNLGKKKKIEFFRCLSII